MHVARFIVSADGTSGTGANYSTIAAAIAAASSGDTIAIQPGTYIEDLTIKAGLNIIALNDDLLGNVKIIGKLTFSGAGARSLSGIYLQDNGDNIISMSGSSGNNGNEVFLTRCTIVCLGGVTAISSTGSSAFDILEMIYCEGDVSDTSTKLFNWTSTGNLYQKFCFFTNGEATGTPSTTSSTISHGTCTLFSSEIPSAITTSSNASLYVFNSAFNVPSNADQTWLTCGGSGAHIISSSYLDSGGSATIVANTTIEVSNCLINSSAAAAISGSGTAYVSGTSFLASSAISTTNVGGIIQKVGAPAYQYKATATSYSVLSTDSIIGVTSNASARTITLPNSGLTVGQCFTVKDEAGTAASANNITISGNGANIDGAATYVITTNYGSVDIYWNGTQFYLK